MLNLTFHLYDRDDGIVVEDISRNIGQVAYAVEVLTGLNVSYAEWSEDDE